MALKRQGKSGWQQDLAGKFQASKKIDLGFQATSFQRFDKYDKRAGIFFGLRPSERWNLEVRYLQGMGNEILPEKQTTLTVYHALTKGIAPFLIYRDSRYTMTSLQAIQLGAEIEKIPGFFFLPMIQTGKASFKAPANDRTVYSLGGKAIYLKENAWSVGVFAFQGREASQGIIGGNSIVVNTFSAGFSVLRYLHSTVKAEFVFDRTQYKELKNQFLTSTLNLTWMF